MHLVIDRLNNKAMLIIFNYTALIDEYLNFYIIVNDAQQAFMGHHLQLCKNLI